MFNRKEVAVGSVENNLNISWIAACIIENKSRLWVEFVSDVTAVSIAKNIFKQIENSLLNSSLQFKKSRHSLEFKNINITPKVIFTVAHFHKKIP